MNILICGPENSGCERTLRLVVNMFKLKHMEMEVVKDDGREHEFGAKKNRVCHMPHTVFMTSNFWKVYPHMKVFDAVILCIRDCRYICNSLSEMAKYCQDVQCWNIFSQLNIKYELYGPEQIMEIAKVLHIETTHNDIVHLLNKVHIVGMNREMKCNELIDGCIPNSHFISKFMETYGYTNSLAHKLEVPSIPHSMSWS